MSFHVTFASAMMRPICSRPTLVINGPIAALIFACMLDARIVVARVGEVAPVIDDAPVCADPATEALPEIVSGTPEFAPGTPVGSAAVRAGRSGRSCH